MTVVLAHGFLRSLASMRGWAAHLASHGVPTAVVSFCNSTPFAGHHDRNADGNMLPVAAQIASAQVVRVPNATHCHFEAPYAPLCERLCGRVEPPDAADAIRATIRALATAWVLTYADSP